jgi:dihydropteroate synthase
VSRVVDCDRAIRQGRMDKAQQFAEAATVVRELAEESGDVVDAYVTLCVHAGIAASDVICCARLGRSAQEEGHHEAVDLLKAAAPGLERHLAALLGMKTKSGYSHLPAPAGEVKRAGRAIEALLGEARNAHGVMG